MAAATGRKTGARRKTTTATKKNTRRSTSKAQERMDAKVRDEVTMIISFAVALLLFLCNFHIIGSVGNALSKVMFGLFGWLAYVAPLLVFVAIIFGTINYGNHIATIKLIAGVLLFIVLDILAALIGGTDKIGTRISSYYTYSADYSAGGGVLGGFFATAMHSLIGMAGTVCICLVMMIVCFVVITERSFIGGVRDKGRRIYDNALEDRERRRELSERRREEREQMRLEYLAEEEYEDEDEEEWREEMPFKIPKKRGANKKDSLFADTKLEPEKTRKKSALVTIEKQKKPEKEAPGTGENGKDPLAGVRINGVEVTDIGIQDVSQPIAPIKSASRNHAITVEPVTVLQQEPAEEEPENAVKDHSFDDITDKIVQEAQTSIRNSEVNASAKVKLEPKDLEISGDMKQVAKPVKPYKMPPLSLLKKGENKNGDSTRELKETALKLQNILEVFGVKATVTDISKGPAVTRYELQPEIGVKVSKIVNLSDDIKLNLAATDIRIEAPIPGKAAVGIEVPNKENSAVALRDLLEASQFQDFKSKLAFAVGKDISGSVVVADIAKMPHVLIAGSTGSGKSVCINTLIMSILYKAKPDEVKMILVDPKVVELSVYNGIPHLMVPVVTDPKKAAAALNWGVAEMDSRYNKFAEFGVRDLASYNKKVSEMTSNGGEELPQRLPQIVIIVDELADLMMVAPGEVETSICRLAQLARAAGIHLVIATQRPSVDVITGLIKANMPSRVAFAVSSGVDSRTILDMNGAEKLLGKGDMLFYPQGYPKPSRVQGAFVSDDEVAAVVEYIKSQCDEPDAYSSEIADKIASMESSSSVAGGGAEGSSRDEYFADAGKFIIEKDKASIGMLQRMFKIGFNRAARIMDQLSDYGVVGEEEGTKPRKVLMSMEQFEQLLEEI